VFGSLCYIVAM